MSLFLAYLGALRPNWNWMYIEVCKAGSWTPGCRCFWPTSAFAPELELGVLHASTYVKPVHGHQDVVVSGLPRPLRPNWNWMCCMHQRRFMDTRMSLFLAYLGASRPNWNWMYIAVHK
jgi:hypothetical protein